MTNPLKFKLYEKRKEKTLFPCCFLEASFLLIFFLYVHFIFFSFFLPKIAAAGIGEVTNLSTTNLPKTVLGNIMEYIS